MKKEQLSLILFVFLIFSLVSCDLLNGNSDVDILKKIDDEIAWANATKLTVRIAATPWDSPNPSPGPALSSPMPCLPS